MSCRTLWILSVFLAGCCGFVVEVRAQREHKTSAVAEFDARMLDEKVGRRADDLWKAEEWEIKNYLDPMQSNVRTRFGTVPMKRAPERWTNEHPRVPGAMIFGRNNRFLGVNPNDPSLRFKPLPPSGRSMSSVDPSEPSITVPEASSVNRPIQGDVPTAAGSVRQPVGFFERPGIIEPPPLVSGEQLMRSPSDQRWFRDLGRRPASPDLGAVAVGGDDAFRPEPSNTLERELPTGRTAVDSAASRRRFEQKLEGMLLGVPDVHFLSPVRVSFQGGIATVRGVVADRRHKIAAGNILLTDPRVHQVDNLISVVPTAPSRNPPPIEPKP